MFKSTNAQGWATDVVEKRFKSGNVSSERVDAFEQSLGSFKKSFDRFQLVLDLLPTRSIISAWSTKGTGWRGLPEQKHLDQLT